MSHQSSVGKCYQTNATNVLQHHRANRLCENKDVKYKTVKLGSTWPSFRAQALPHCDMCSCQ